MKLFTTQNCPNCKKLKETLDNKGIIYEEMDIETAEGLGDYYFYNRENRLSVPMLIEVDEKEVFVKDVTNAYSKSK